MKLLLDTHILLWSLSDSPRLSRTAREMVSNESNIIYYSIISLWETEIKHQLRPDAISAGARELSAFCRASGYLELPVSDSSVFALETLRRSPEEKAHNDPFDRIMICQAKTEKMLFLTHDSLIQGYNEPCIFPV